jgi:hypothetical protein
MSHSKMDLTNRWSSPRELTDQRLSFVRCGSSVDDSARLLNSMLCAKDTGPERQSG